ncbi:uncharacterized protein LOC120260253 [Dioscorea cayenensis subsp. rotundata]|uniref:Uncharacterized protein LOC120260253 n=1 Tax=Dioscorea cayennensis subsp. rotundata TaxID=55577 RepID=A0AB40B8L7_DIOCR|nr:uncharacterized protein LOC120260253 [Dioscorea cayenensis subsp. rotundata]
MFWLDNWVEGCALADICPHLFLLAQSKEETIVDFLNRGPDPTVYYLSTVSTVLNTLHSQPSSGIDERRWKLSSNGKFSVKTFYNFLNDGGLRCDKTKVILKGDCPKKVNLFNWLALDNKILTLDNLALRGCNVLPTTTCVMCHADVETAEHLLLHCPLATHIWTFFAHLLGARHIPRSLVDLWGDWRRAVPKSLLPFWDLLVRAINRNIWLKRNARIFTANCLSITTRFLKLSVWFFLWFSRTP